jgi:hypothetical protein
MKSFAVGGIIAISLLSSLSGAALTPVNDWVSSPTSIKMHVQLPSKTAPNPAIILMVKCFRIANSGASV